MTTHSHWDRAKTLFHRALDMDAQDRAVLLDVECASDENLRSEIDRLLEHHRAEDSFLQLPLPNALGADLSSMMHEAIKSDLDGLTEPTMTGDRQFGRYRLLDEIGRGGMGVVYRAEQDKPRREVAVKILPPTLASPRMMRRFELEAELLGRLRHRGIARIYDAGTVQGSLGPQAYFAMELIEGCPIDARARSLSIPDRLELIARVCDAVHHAHQQGVIHRDLKPANILVDDAGNPVVLDFGVARAMDEDRKTITVCGGLIGTLAYMSPEQLDGEADTRSDVYALGLIAHKVLTGSLPYRVDNQPIDRAMSIIRSMVPQRIGAQDRALRGDIETIVAHAIEKDPDRRYDSAAAMALDIRRTLAHQPIAARRPTARYHLALVARRHRALTATAALVLTAMIAWSITSVVMIARAGPAVAQQASLASYHAQALKDTHQTVRHLLTSMSDKELRSTIATIVDSNPTYRSLDLFAAECQRRGMVPEALQLRQEAAVVAKRHNGLSSPITMRQIQVLAETHIESKDFDSAGTLLTRSLQSVGYGFEPRIDESRVPSRIHSTTLRLGWTLAEVHHRQGQIVRAEEEYRIVLADQFRMFRDHTDWLDTLDNLVYLLVGEDRAIEAEQVIHQYLDDERFEATDEQQPTIARISGRFKPKVPVYYSLAATGNAAGLR